MNTRSARSRGRIVVINDDTDFLELMHELLQDEEGFEVPICREWDNAHGSVKDHPPDLVILDIRMGGEAMMYT